MKPRPISPRCPSSPTNLIVFCLGLASAAVTMPSAQAASATWNTSPTNGIWEAAGTENNWSTGAGLFPGAIGTTNNTDTATFSSTSSTTSISINSTAGNTSALNVGSIVFTGASLSAFTIGSTGGNTLLFTANSTVASSGTPNANIYYNTSVNSLNQTVSAPIKLQGNAFFSNQSTGTSSSLIIDGAISGNASGNFTLALRANATTGQSNFINGNISNGSATNLGITTYAGPWTLAGSNTYTGLTTAGGLVTVMGSNSGSGAYTINSGGNFVFNTSGTIVASVVGSQSVSSTRGVTLTGGVILQVNTDVGATGSGNDFAPGLIFNNGTLKSGNASGITVDATSVSTTPDHKATVLAGGATFDTTTGSINGVTGFFLNGTTAGAITVKGGNTLKAGVTNTGLLALQDNSTWNTNGVASSVAGLSSTNGTITNTGSASTLTTNFSGSQTFGGIISGASNLSLTKSGTGNQILTGTNTYTGATTISTGGTLQLGSGSTTGSLSSSSSITTNGTFAVNRSNAVTQGTDFGTIIAGTGGVTHSGAGTLTLNTANTYSGTTLISSGTLVASSSGALGSSTVNNNSKLQVTGDITLNNAITTRGETNSNPSASAGAIESTGNNRLNGNINFGNTGGLITNVISKSGSLTIAGNVSTTLVSGRTFNFGGAGNTTISGSISDGTSAVSVSKNGAGTLTLAGTNAYTGTTTVSAGTLFISGELGNSDVLALNNSVIGAGDASGAIGGNLHFDSGSKLDVSLGVLTVSSTKTVSFGGFDFTSLVGFDVESAAIGTYTLIAGNFSLNSSNIAHYGTANAFTRLDGNKAYFDQGSLAVTIAAVPEPIATLFGGLGMLVLLRRRR